MKSVITLIIITILFSCNHRKTSHDFRIDKVDADFTIAFGSCNNQRLHNDLWNEILKNNPDVWIWGGDNIYADTDDMKIMQSYYNEVKNNDDYKDFLSKVDVHGTWDDHDFGINDGGTEFIKKDSSQQLFLDFFDVPLNDSRRNRRGVYYSKIFEIGDKSIKIIILDTRYFRTALTADPSGNKRYIPTVNNEGTILGSSQWAWLEKELNNSDDDFTIIMSSIQFLSYEHGFETWGNMPHEVEKLNSLIVNSKAERVILLSGDRHLSEISVVELEGLDYPLYDFTSSGLTHTYTSYTFEPNKYRKSKVITAKNFGLLKFDLESNTVSMELRGVGNNLLESMIQKY
jgi:alkaline phosphatase D